MSHTLESIAKTLEFVLAEQRGLRRAVEEHIKACLAAAPGSTDEAKAELNRSASPFPSCLA